MRSSARGRLRALTFRFGVRPAGAKANSRTGLHVHVGAADFTPDNIKNLVPTFYKQEELILKAVEPNRAVSRGTRARPATSSSIRVASFGLANLSRGMVQKRRFDNRGMVQWCQFDDSSVCDLTKLKLHFTFAQAV